MDEKVKKEKLLSEFRLTLINEVSDFNKEIVGVKNLYEFFKAEYEFWNTIENKNDIVNEYVNYFANSTNQLQKILETYDNKAYEDLESALGNFHNDAIKQYYRNSSFKVIFSTSPKAHFLKDFYKENLREAAIAHQYFLNYDFGHISDKYQVLGLVKAIIFEAEKEDKLYKRRNAERKSISILSEKYSERLLRSNSDYEKFKQEINEWRDEINEHLVTWLADYEKKSEDYYTAKGKELTDLEELYTKKLQLEGPVQYWKDRAKKYKKSGMIWVGFLSVTILVSVLMLCMVLYDMPVAFGYKLFNGEPQAVRGIIIFFSIISFLAYIARTFTKLIFSSFHLQRDAEEREQLTLVYLALIEKGAIANEERGLVLQSLFSRSDTGMLSHDSNPTMPGLQSILEKLGKG